MHTENFLDLTTTDGVSVCIAKSSIALIEGNQNSISIITLKEKRADGTQIILSVNYFYTNLKIELNRWEKMTP